MIEERAHAKLNLYLHVTGKRPDGFHLLDSLMAFTEYGDTITVETAPSLTLSLTGPFARDLAGEGDNLVLKAARALQSKAGHPHGAHITLAKHLPLASGIGGGSADAAATLRALNRLWLLNLKPQELVEIALTLGSDTASCIASTPVRAEGVGDMLTPLTLPQPLYAVLANPLIHLPTPDVYRLVTPPYRGHAGEWSVDGLRALVAFLHDCGNDLQAPAMALAPEIGKILKRMSQLDDVLLVRMSGSGATCFALFPDKVAAERASEILTTEWSNYWIMATEVRTHG